MPCHSMKCTKMTHNIYEQNNVKSEIRLEIRFFFHTQIIINSYLKMLESKSTPEERKSPKDSAIKLSLSDDSSSSILSSSSVLSSSSSILSSSSSPSSSPPSPPPSSSLLLDSSSSSLDSSDCSDPVCNNMSMANKKRVYKKGTDCVFVSETGIRDPYGASAVPIYQTATFKQTSATDMGDFDYTRSGNPTRSNLGIDFSLFLVLSLSVLSTLLLISTLLSLSTLLHTLYSAIYSLLYYLLSTLLFPLLFYIPSLSFLLSLFSLFLSLL
jgi:hypothetical protein